MNDYISCDENREGRGLVFSFLFCNVHFAVFMESLFISEGCQPVLLGVERENKQFVYILYRILKRWHTHFLVTHQDILSFVNHCSSLSFRSKPRKSKARAKRTSRAEEQKIMRRYIQKIMSDINCILRNALLKSSSGGSECKIEIPALELNLLDKESILSTPTKGEEGRSSDVEVKSPLEVFTLEDFFGIFPENEAKEKAEEENNIKEQINQCRKEHRDYPNDLDRLIKNATIIAKLTGSDEKSIHHEDLISCCREICEQIISLNPEDNKKIMTFHALGYATHDIEYFNIAIEMIKIQKAEAKMLYSKSNIIKKEADKESFVENRQGAYFESIELYQKTIQTANRLLNELILLIMYSFSNCANILKKTGYLDKSEEYFRRAAKTYQFIDDKNKDPFDIARINYSLAMNTKKVGKLKESHAFFQKAVAGFKSVLEKRPDYFDARKELGDMFFSQDFFGESIYHYYQVKSSDRYSLSGRSFMRAGEFKPALYHYKKAIDLDPDYAPDYGYYGFLLFLSQEFDQAEQALLKGIKLFDGWECVNDNLVGADFHFLLGFKFLYRQIFNEAADHYKKGFAITSWGNNAKKELIERLRNSIKNASRENCLEFMATEFLKDDFLIAFNYSDGWLNQERKHRPNTDYNGYKNFLHELYRELSGLNN